MAREPVLTREEALAVVWTLMDILAKLEEIRGLLSEEDDEP